MGLAHEDVGVGLDETGKVGVVLDEVGVARQRQEAEDHPAGILRRPGDAALGGKGLGAEPPDPPLTGDDAKWARALVKAARKSKPS